MAPSYTLYGATRSRSTRIAWLLDELGVPWTWQPLSFRAGDNRTPAFRALNPSGKVPVLVADGTAITESAAIARFLCARHPDAGLMPAEGTLDGARVDQWLFFVTTELEQALWTKAKHTFALPAKLRVPAVRETANTEFKRAVAVAAAMHGDAPYAVGDTFTVADLFFAHTLIWGKAAGLWEVIPPELQAYALRQLRRPAYQSAVSREADSE